MRAKLALLLMVAIIPAFAADKKPTKGELHATQKQEAEAAKVKTRKLKAVRWYIRKVGT